MYKAFADVQVEEAKPDVEAIKKELYDEALMIVRYLKDVLGMIEDFGNKM